MEKLTCNEITFTFFNFQPIQIKDHVMTKYLNSSINLMKLNNYYTKNKPKWLEQFSDTKSVYKKLNTINIPYVDVNILLNETKSNFFVYDELSLYSKLNFNEIKVFLIYDYHSLFWSLCYEIEVNFCKNDIEKYLEVKDKTSKKNDLYNTIRNILVKENDDSNISKWTENIQSNCFTAICKVLQRVHNIKACREDIFVQNNTGNITNLVTFNGIDSEDANEISQSLKKLNYYAERINYDETSIVTPNTYMYTFNGRFHTLVLKNEEYKYRYIPIHYHMQYLWSYLSQTYKIMDILNNLILEDRSSKLIKTQSELIDNIINKVQKVRIYNEKFKSAIEIDNESVYLIIQKKWNIENLLNVSEQYTDNFKDYLNRLYMRQNAKNDSKQNNILFFISMLQMIALMSVWNDYISIVNHNNISSADLIVSVFGSVEKLQTFNVYLPIFFILFIFVLYLYSLFSNK